MNLYLWADQKESQKTFTHNIWSTIKELFIDRINQKNEYKGIFFSGHDS